MEAAEHGLPPLTFGHLNLRSQATPLQMDRDVPDKLKIIGVVEIKPHQTMFPPQPR